MPIQHQQASGGTAAATSVAMSRPPHKSGLLHCSIATRFVTLFKAWFYHTGWAATCNCCCSISCTTTASRAQDQRQWQASTNLLRCTASHHLSSAQLPLPPVQRLHLHQPLGAAAALICERNNRFWGWLVSGSEVDG